MTRTEWYTKLARDAEVPAFFGADVRVVATKTGMRSGHVLRIRKGRRM